LEVTVYIQTHVKPQLTAVKLHSVTAQLGKLKCKLQLHNKYRVVPKSEAAESQCLCLSQLQRPLAYFNNDLT